MIEGTEGISLTQSLLTRLDGNGVAINGFVALQLTYCLALLLSAQWLESL